MNYMNQSSPFWDFISQFDDRRGNSPWPDQQQQQPAGNERREGDHPHPPPPPPPFGPWVWGFPGFDGRAFPHRGPPPPRDRSRGPPHNEDHDEEGEANNTEKEKNAEDNNNSEGPSGGPSSDREEPFRGRRRCGGGRGRPGFGPRGHHPHHHGPPPGPHGPFSHGGSSHTRSGCARGRGSCGAPRSWNRGGGGAGRPSNNWFHTPPPNPLPFDPITLFHPNNLAALTQLFANQFAPNANPATNTTTTTNPDPNHPAPNDSITPPIDLFSTPTAYILHISLPGAQKEDISVNWDVETSQLCVSGVVYRPFGGEEMMSEHLVLGEREREVGFFERKIKLGGSGGGDHGESGTVVVDAEGITAKLEDGVLRVEVPKLELEGGFVDVRRVDVE